MHIFDIPSLSDTTNQPPVEVYTLHGHTAPITSVISGRQGQDVVSASWDGSINLYVLPPGGVGHVDEEHYAEAEPTTYLPGQKKRRRLNKSKDAAEGESAGQGQVEGLTDGEIGQAGWRRNPDNTLMGHKGRIGGMVWDKNENKSSSLNGREGWGVGWGTIIIWIWGGGGGGWGVCGVGSGAGWRVVPRWVSMSLSPLAFSTLLWAPFLVPPGTPDCCTVCCAACRCCVCFRACSYCPVVWMNREPWPTEAGTCSSSSSSSSTRASEVEKGLSVAQSSRGSR